MEIGRKIREFRNSRHMTIDQVSEITGISKPVISKIENGHRGIDFSELVKISDAMGTKVKYLLDEEGDDLFRSDILELLDNLKDFSPEQIEKLNSFLKSIR